MAQQTANRQQQSTETLQAVTVAGPTKQASQSIQSLLGSNATLQAEICWTLKVITSHYSLKSCEDISSVFKFMFPDSETAKHFACGERKAAYLATFGIAPHFLSLLKWKVRDQSEYVLLFDESLNSEMQSKQLDVLVRYWNADKVESRYFTSYFLGHADAEAVHDKFESVCGDLGYEKLAQLSMDGPNVNWKVFRLMQEDVEKQSGKKLLNIGSCGLHVIHNSFRDGCSAAEWEVETFLSSGRWLFKDSPARCEDYTSVTGSTCFPLDFCRHRWLENVPVVERALEIIPFVVQYVTAAKSGKVTEPKNKSFENVQQSVKDPLLTAKLNFFLMIAKEIQPFLTKYQADKPLLPFFATDMKNLVKELMQKFIKADVLSNAKSVVKLLNIEYEKFPNHVDLSKVNIGFAAERILRELKGSKKLSEKHVFEFRMNCKAFLIKMVKKLVDKFPLTYPLVRYMNFLDPRIFIAKKETSAEKLTRILRIMSEAGRISDNECDKVMLQFNHFHDNSLTADSEAFNGFSMETGRVDTFYFDRLSNKADFKELWKVVKLLLALSHGQATVERGFSSNKEVMVENLAQHSLVAQRVICDHVRSVGGVLNVVFSKELLLSAASGRQRYHTALDEKRRENEATRRSDRKRSLLDEIFTLKEKKRRLETDFEALKNSTDSYAEKAESTGRLTLIAKSNGMRRTAREKREQIMSLEDEIENKLKQLKGSL